GESVMNGPPYEEYTNYPRVFDEVFFRSNPNAVRRAKPDVYTFNVNGLTGKFIIERLNGVFTAKIIEKTDFVKIEIGNLNDINNIEKITIYDKKGYKYIFSNPSNINHNQSVNLTYLKSSYTLYPGCTLTTSAVHDTRVLAPSFESVTQLDEGMILSGSINSGEKFWENMELTSIYDNNNRQLISYEYDNILITQADLNNAWINGIGLTNSYNKLYLKKINIINQGYIIFNNTIVNYSTEINKSYTNVIEIRNLKGELIKKIKFNYQNYTSPLLRTYKEDVNKSFSFSKRFLTKITESDGSSNKNLITTLEYNNMHINGDNTLVDRYGFLANSNEYCTTHLKRSNYKADFYILKKINYPTGGTVIYKFGPNKFSRGTYYNTPIFKENNGDNHLYVNKVGVISENNTYRIPVNPGDTLAILNMDTYTLNVYSSNVDFSYNNRLPNGTIPLTKKGDLNLDDSYCKHEFKKIIIPENYSSNYIYLKYPNSQTNFFNNVKVYKFSYK